MFCIQLFHGSMFVSIMKIYAIVPLFDHVIPAILMY